MTRAEWEAKGAALFGPDLTKWRFKCPICGNVMSVEKARAEFPELKGSGLSIEQECVGRYSPKVLRPDGTRCDWAAYGLFRGPVIVTTENGKEVPAFEFDEPAPATAEARP